MQAINTEEMEITKEELNRYSRQMKLQGFGREGQMRLKNAHVLVIGAGGLGSPVLLYLASAGVGHITILDNDTVDLSDLQRQVIHTSDDVDRPKVVSAKEKMLAINPLIDVRIVEERASQANLRGFVEESDFVLECTDSFATKYLVNDVCVECRKPFCIAGIEGFNGQVMTHIEGTATYRDIFPRANAEAESCSAIGVLGSAVGILGTIQATECVKCLLGLTDHLLTNRLFLLDALNMTTTDIKL